MINDILMQPWWLLKMPNFVMQMELLNIICPLNGWPVVNMTNVEYRPCFHFAFLDAVQFSLHIFCLLAFFFMWPKAHQVKKKT